MSRAAIVAVFGMFLSALTALAGPVGVAQIKSPAVAESLKKRSEAARKLEKVKKAIVPQSKNIGYEILELETPLGTVTPDMYKRLDSMIAAVKVKVKPKPKGDQAAIKVHAVETLLLIDEVLVANNVVYPPIDELTLTFSDSLTPTKLDNGLFERIIHEPENDRRVKHIQDHRTEEFFLADCDTGSFIYLAIGEALDLPLYLVEVPKHNFVRWYFSDTEYLNWETMYGKERSDQVYQGGYGIPQSAIDNGAFLAKMSREATTGYCHAIVGMGYAKLNKTKEVQAEYRISLNTYNKAPLAWNNLAWSLVTARDAKFRDGAEAVRLASKAVEIFREANNLDTLACAYAEAGDFTKAIEIEQQAIEIAFDPSERAQFVKNLKAFQQNQTWIQSHPEDKQAAFHFFGHR